MKKKLPFLMISLILFICSILSSCQYDSPKSIVGAQLNDRGELILTYSDDTTQNLGVVKGENGKDGKDGVDLTPCAHTYGDWQTQLAPSCTSIGYATRSCSLCGDLDYLITNPLGHTYENPVEFIHTCQQHFLNKTCTTCGDTALVEEPATKDHFYGDWKTVEEYACGAIKQEKSCIYCNEKQIQTLNFSAHTFDENTLCTTCGYQEFIESEEYITIQKDAIDAGEFYPFDLYTWNSVDGSYSLQIMSNPYSTFISGYSGTPVNIILPSKINGTSIIYIGKQYGMGFTALPFKNCETLESIYIQKNMKIHARSLSAHPFIGCSNLKYVYLEEGAGCFTQHNNEIFPHAEIFYL